MIHHGGKLLEFSARFGIPVEDWLDLSTGVSPYTYPVSDIPTNVWNRLPEDEDGLIEAAQQYYQSPHLLPIAGSQAGIQLLPSLLCEHRVLTEVPILPTFSTKPLRVLLPAVGYKEHQHAWQQCAAKGLAELHFYDGKPDEQSIANCDVLLVINPNNPQGGKMAPDVIQSWLSILPAHGVLVVDEAFMDMTPNESVLPLYPQGVPSNLFVFRSVGKFFGLAGIRLGFLFASTSWLKRVQVRLGPWTVSGPARYVAKQALSDHQWQQQNREKLLKDGEKMRTLLRAFFCEVEGQTLFHTVACEEAEKRHTQLAQRGILVRLCDEGDALRIGLPYGEAQWCRLEEALRAILK
ncbi:threonine-phosphate decarboxylase [Vibrio sp. S9_S30]|uniref:threonine-phosphate decarboxylase CobD n=1 Tax=Vibrio sp. S9_S30 TaxID=2720226 RepID=UPI001680BE8A|nr:threonine-phosphate decarboxylase CobD [Vibrio sp. S9_S30]MBD1556156.1 threonine-phosphate decarboxylase [Vibrio sp. S9_S30]